MGEIMAKKETAIDPRTGFPFGYHGGYSHAVDFALDSKSLADDTERVAFLAAWREGGPDFPEYYDHLRKIGVTG